GLDVWLLVCPLFRCHSEILRSRKRSWIPLRASSPDGHGILQSMLASALAPGCKLDRYTILESVAVGGVGSVWLASFAGKHGFSNKVALKTILPERATDDRFRRMFLDEARILARIEHANVAQILDLGENGGLLYLILEWVEGPSVKEIAEAVEAEGGTLPL